MDSVFRPRYRADIDGLRAIAVLAVVGFHAFPGRIPGGFVGVDVFFVISGFLITGLITGAVKTHRFSFRDFYARRVRRIFPALAVVLIVCAAAGWFVLLADDYEQLGRHLAAGAAFIPNLVLWHDTSYFDAGSATKPLLHLWSLGVEEQFYLVWPLTLYAALRLGVNERRTAFLLACASFALNVYVTGHDATAAFYSPATRMWELLTGAVLAQADEGVALSSFVRDGASIAGAMLIAAAVLLVQREASFPGWWALLPTGGTALSIAAGREAVVNRTVLGRPSLVAVGLISYPLYLWHWPLLAFATVATGDTPALLTRCLVVVASFALAWVTYRLVERPIRFGVVGRSRAVPILCSALAVIGGVGATTYAAAGFPQRALNFSDRGRFLRYYERLHTTGLADAYWAACDFYDWDTKRTRASIASECTQRGERHTVLLWGDSYAQALSFGLRQLLASGDRLAQVTASACPPALIGVDDLGRNDDRCWRMNRTALDAVRMLRPDVVIVAERTGHELKDWDAIASALRTRGAGRVVVVGPSPEWKPSLPLVVANRGLTRDFARVKEGLDAHAFEVDQLMRTRHDESRGFEYVSLLQTLCNADGCLATVPGGGLGDLMAVDSGHLTPAGSRFVADHILAKHIWLTPLSSGAAGPTKPLAHSTR